MQSCHQQALDSVQGTEQASSSLKAIDASNQGISDMASQIASAVEQQNMVSVEVSGNTDKIRSVADILSQQAEESRKRVAHLRDRVEELRKLTDQFRV